MKKKLGHIIISTAVIIFLFLIWGVYSKKIGAAADAEKIRVFPDFTLPDVNGEAFNSRQVTAGPVLITYFHPECEHCQDEISSILHSELLGENLKILFISYADRDQIDLFFRQFDLNVASSIRILYDTSFVFKDIFGTEIIPANYIYDKDLQLVKTMKGKASMATIIKYFRQCQ
jgi:thiol-disulfide isomerase/thioredoxin